MLLTGDNNLYKWGIKQSAKCNFCENVDTVTYHLFECHKSADFWIKVQSFIDKKLGVKINFTIYEVIFGIPLTDDPLAEILIILLFLENNISIKM